MTATATSPPSATAALPELAADLVLARLLAPTQKPPTPSQVREGLGKLFQQAPSAEEFGELVGSLRAAGLVEEKRLRLTPAGRDRALAFLGTSELPPRCTWQTIQSRYLLPRALGLRPDAGAGKKMDKDKLAALLLKRRFQLPVGTGPSLRSVLEALACRELGFPEQATLAEVKDLALSRKLGSDRRLSTKDLTTQVPRVLLDTPRSGLAGLREVALREWAGDGIPPRPSPEAARAAPPPDAAFDLSAFAHTVRAVARDCPTGRFGDNKVFISHVARRLAGEPGFAGMGLETFKRKLVEANTARLLTLSRADLVSVMDPADVRESETHDLNAVFHFILIERGQP
jgi:hypothetical protein